MLIFSKVFKMKQRIFCLLSLSFCLIFSACQTIEGLRMGGFDHPLSDLQKVILKTLPQGKRSIDSIGRTFKSQYFLSQGDEFLSANSPNLKERYFAEITILGFNRPYSLEVIVFKERVFKQGLRENRKPSSSNYKIVGLNFEIAEIILDKIKENLYKLKAHRNKNFIDDFRVF